MIATVDRLRALIPELEYSRETHVQWANCSDTSRARNPDIGNADFHNKCVAEYDERIAAINEAIAALLAAESEREGLRKELDGWNNLLAAFIRSGMPEPFRQGTPQLWPNPDWTQDQAMIAFALHHRILDTAIGSGGAKGEGGR